MAKQITIIGGGASGLMAAIAAAQEGADVTVLEQNEKPGKKVLSSGNGKCNLTNRQIDPALYYTDDPSVVRKVFDIFSEEDTIRFFEDLGLRVFDRNGWVYPCTEQASSVLDLLLFEAERLGVRIKNNEEVISIGVQEIAAPFMTYTKSWKYASDAVILAAGSKASSVRGSSDLAIRLADSLGLVRFPFLPALVPLCVKEPVSQVWNGTRVHGTVTLIVDGKPAKEETGELQMTSYGISGIPVLQISRKAVRALQEGREVQVCINFLPEVTADELEEIWRQRESLFPEKTNRQLLTGLLPEKIITVLLDHAGLRGHEVPMLTDHAEGGAVEKLLGGIRQFPLTIRGTGPYEQAQICTGGIALSGMQPDLSLKKLPGFFVTGEAANVDGPCGGYNLQWAWSSGYVAGKAAAVR